MPEIVKPESGEGEGMTKEEGLVLEAAQLLADSALNECRMGSRLKEAVKAYRRSLKPPARYVTKKWPVGDGWHLPAWAVVGPSGNHYAYTHDASDANRIAALLNAEEGVKDA